MSIQLEYVEYTIRYELFIYVSPSIRGVTGGGGGSTGDTPGGSAQGGGSSAQPPREWGRELCSPGAWEFAFLIFFICFQVSG